MGVFGSKVVQCTRLREERYNIADFHSQCVRQSVQCIPLCHGATCLSFVNMFSMLLQVLC